MIPGGYYLKARKTQESWIAHAPPHVREIWDWLIANANSKPKNLSGKIIERGQLYTNYESIIEGLHWMVGYRKERYTKAHTETAMKALTKAAMITTTKTAHGMIVTICKYEQYQNPKNYENRNENRNENHTKEQEVKKEEVRRKIKNKHSECAALPEWLDPQAWEAYREHRNALKPKMSPYAEQLTIQKLETLKDAGNDPKLVLLQSIEMGWKGIFEIKQGSSKNANGTGLTKVGQRNLSVAQAYLEKRGPKRDAG